MAFVSDITLGQYFPGDSFVHQLDPRTKLLSVLLLMTALLVSKNLWIILFFILLLVVITVFSKIPFSLVFKNLKPFFWLFILTMIVHLFWTPGKPLFELKSLHLSLTYEGFMLGLQYSIRLAVLIVLAALLTLSTLPIELTDALDKLFRPLKKIGLPSHEIVMMLTLSLRFIPTLIEETQRLKNAQMSRGASYEGSIMDRAKNIVPLIIPLFISAFRRADDLALAMDSRCYHGGDSRSSYTVLSFKYADYITLSACLVLFTFCIIAL